MQVIHTTGGGFAVDRSGLRGSSPFVLTAGLAPETGSVHPLVIVADLVESVPGTEDFIEDLLNGMAKYLGNVRAGEVHAELVRAFAFANSRVLDENSSRKGMRRFFVGMTCVVIADDDVYIAQCAPGQVLVWQDDIMYAIPALDSWTARDITGTFSALSYPLGFRHDIQPRIAYSRYAPGDVIAVVSWQLARHLHYDGNLHDDSPPSALIQALSTLEAPDGFVRFHGGVFKVGSAPAINTGYTTKLGIDESPETGESRHASWLLPETESLDGPGTHSIASRQPPYSGGRGAYRFDTLESGTFRNEVTEDLPLVEARNHGTASEASYVELGASAVQFTGPGSTDSLQHLPATGSEHCYRFAAAKQVRDGRPPAREGHRVEIFAGLLLSLSAAVVGVWQVTKRDRPIHGPRDDGTLGLPHLQRWSDSYQRPRFDQVRRVSPRFQVNGFLLVGAVIAVVALAGVLVFNSLNNRADGQAAGIEARLQSIAAVRQQTDTSTPGESSYESLLGAQVALDELEGAATTEDLRERVQEEQAAVATALEELASVERVTSVQVLGSLPPAPDGVTARLFSGGGSVFVLSGAFYELDQIGGTLVQLLAAGDLVGGDPVGKLLAGAWSDDRPVVVDSRNAYLRDPADGRWHRVSLGTLNDSGYSDITAMSAFSRNIYYLDSGSGQILKFDALDFSATPEDWAAGSAREQLQRATDLYIDGSIHAVLNDGQVLTFFRSAHDGTITPDVLPPLESARALTTIREGQYFFVVDAKDGRIIGFDKEGNLYRQFVTASGVQTLAGATDLVINESNGITYVIANDTLFMVRLSMPTS